MNTNNNNHSPISRHDRNHDYNIERFKTRLTAKSCVVFVCVTQIFVRLIIVFCEFGLNIHTQLLTILSLVPLTLMALIVCFEFFLYKKIGPKVMNYARIIDIILLILFTAEWILSTCVPMTQLPHAPIPLLPVAAIFPYTGFMWRVIFLLFLVQDWKLLIIPPTVALSITMAFVAHYALTKDVFIVLRGFPQIVYTILVLYFLDKTKWKEILMNAQQERWIKINDFVLNNLPENIIILELGGAVTFMSDYCKAFMSKSHLSQNPRDLFTNIKDLYQQPETEPSSPESTLRQPSSVTASQVPLVGKSLGNFQIIEDLQFLIQNFKTIIQEAHLQERQFIVYNGKLKLQDHHTKAIEIKVSFIQQHHREYIILIIRDTTQRDLLVTLEDNNKYKDQLLASVSHELRAPLNGNINLVESAILSPSIPDKIKEKLLTPALRSSKFLLHLINDILDMSQIKAQKLRLTFTSKKLQETLQDTLQLVELQAKKKRIEIFFTVHPDLPQIFWTDHVRLSQIILNLLNNAIKFTQRGSITLSAVPTEDPNCVKILVQDSGMGMTKEDTKKLFSEYTHIEFSERASINPTGVGLGLSIAYSLAKLLGPQGIVVESTFGIGSTFSFIVENKKGEPDDLLSKRTSDKSQGVPNELQEIEPKISSRLYHSLSINSVLLTTERQHLVNPEKSKCSCAKILIVDDNPFNTMAFEAVLGSLDLKCDSVFDGAAAIEKILGRKKTCCGRSYSVVFLDQEMPGMSGSETACELRRLQIENLISPMKIIGCTAHGSAEEVDRFMESGIDLCIHKPITASAIQRILQDSDLI